MVGHLPYLFTMRGGVQMGTTPRHVYQMCLTICDMFFRGGHVGHFFHDSFQRSFFYLPWSPTDQTRK